MILDEAIKVLEGVQRSYVNDEEWQAIQLGIQALKLVKELRECMPGSAVKLLPGETEGDT